jgi:hypothetical protein
MFRKMVAGKNPSFQNGLIEKWPRFFFALIGLMDLSKL